MKVNLGNVPMVYIIQAYYEYSFHTESPRLAEGSIPILPVIIEASSDNISPKMLFVTIVSNCKIQS